MALLEIADLSVRYGKALALEVGVHDRRRRGARGVLGPNGAGKTTLLKAISRTMPATGTLKLQGRNRSTAFLLTASLAVASATARKAGACSRNCRF